MALIGWFKMWRQAVYNPDLAGAQKLGAWTWILANVKREDDFESEGRRRVRVPAGCVYLSERRCAEEWQVKRHTARNLIKHFERCGMISPASTSIHTSKQPANSTTEKGENSTSKNAVYSVDNWGDWQGQSDEAQPVNNQQTQPVNNQQTQPPSRPPTAICPSFHVKKEEYINTQHSAHAREQGECQNSYVDAALDDFFATFVMHMPHAIIAGDRNTPSLASVMQTADDLIDWRRALEAMSQKGGGVKPRHVFKYFLEVRSTRINRDEAKAAAEQRERAATSTDLARVAIRYAQDSQTDDGVYGF